jgi:hypothetical protein
MKAATPAGALPELGEIAHSNMRFFMEMSDYRGKPDLWRGWREADDQIMAFDIQVQYESRSFEGCGDSVRHDPRKLGRVMGTDTIGAVLGNLRC